MNDPMSYLGSEASLETGTPPFTIELKRLDEKHGAFRPEANLVVTGALRASGLLTALPGDELKSLFFLLSFLSPNGNCLPTVQELSGAMRVSEMKVRLRMKRLAAFRWQGSPLVIQVKRETGMDAYAPSSQVLAVREADPVTIRSIPAAVSPEPGRQAARERSISREAVIAYSREHYARPRDEAERMIAEQMGWEGPAGEDAGEAAELRRSLTGAGMTRDQADHLLASHDGSLIRQQLQWLPYRKAKNPAAFLVAAIEGNYEEPLVLRLQGGAQPNAERPSEEQPAN